ncbi:MAG: tetratricopeptide repeat protein, partial [Anaerolineae bacterium]
PRVFLEYLIASIERTFPGSMAETRRALAGWGGEFNPDAFAGLLVNDIVLNIPDFFMVVLDDYHLIDDSVAINLLLDAFLRRQPENCRLVIASRTIPTLTPRGMALLVARQQVVGLGVNQLRFTPEEIQQLIRQNYGQEITPEQAEALARESEGWITAILLTHHRMWQELIGDLVQAQEGAGSLYNYLASEVLDRLDPARQEFLLQTSILRVLSPSICDALLGRSDSQALLEDLEARNLFTIRVEEDGQVWYRYHRLFREFLQEKLRERSAGTELALHLRAARLLENEGDKTEAIHHYLEAGAYDDAARVIESVAVDLFDAGKTDTLLGWIESLPAPLMRQFPRLAWFKAKILWSRGQLRESLEYCYLAKEAFEAQGESLGAAQALSEASGVLRAQGRYREALEQAQQALVKLGETTQQSWQRTLALAAAHRNIGLCHYQMGDLGLGIQELRKALALYSQATYLPSLAQTHSDLGVLLRASGNTAGARHHFEEALAIWEKVGNPLGMATVLNSIGVTYHHQGDYQKALDIFSMALRRAREAASDRLSGFILAGIGDAHLALGEAEKAMEAYKESEELAERSGDTFLKSYLMGVEAMACLLQGNTSQALPLAREAFERAREQNAQREVALYQIILGAIYSELGRHPRAIELLRQAEESLRAGGAEQDRTRALLHLAAAYFRAGRVDEALRTLEQLADALLELGQYHFLEVDARIARPVLEYAAARQAGGRLTADLVRMTGAKSASAEKPESAEAAPPAAVPPLRVYLLGKTRVFLGDQEIPDKAWQSTKARQLFCYFVVHGQDTRDHAALLFWPDSSVERAAGSFYVTLHRLRRALSIQEIILSAEEVYYLNRDLTIWCDLWEFERLLKEAETRQRQGRLDEAHQLRVEALKLVRGEFCADLPDMEWISIRRHELTYTCDVLLREVVQYHLRRQEWGEALQYGQQMLSLDAFDEAAHRLVMFCQAKMGQRSAAMKHYRSLVRSLQRQEGAEPEPETTELYEQIARRAPDLSLDF